jgi:hypothetical protein
MLEEDQILDVCADGCLDGCREGRATGAVDDGEWVGIDDG